MSGVTEIRKVESLAPTVEESTPSVSAHSDTQEDTIQSDSAAKSESVDNLKVVSEDSEREVSDREGEPEKTIEEAEDLPKNEKENKTENVSLVRWVVSFGIVQYSLKVVFNALNFLECNLNGFVVRYVRSAKHKIRRIRKLGSSKTPLYKRSKKICKDGSRKILSPKKRIGVVRKLTQWLSLSSKSHFVLNSDGSVSEDVAGNEDRKRKLEELSMTQLLNKSISEYSDASDYTLSLSDMSCDSSDSMEFTSGSVVSELEDLPENSSLTTEAVIENDEEETLPEKDSIAKLNGMVESPEKLADHCEVAEEAC